MVRIAVAITTDKVVYQGVLSVKNVVLLRKKYPKTKNGRQLKAVPKRSGNRPNNEKVMPSKRHEIVKM